MKRSKLDKAKGRYQAGERFALIPRDVLESGAYRALPDWAKAVLVALAGQYKGIANGDLSLTWAEARSLGVSSQWKLRAGIKLAERAGLCDVTRPGGNVAGGEKKATLYALGWLPIAPSEKYENPSGSLLKPLNRWATWARPDDWEVQMTAERRRAQAKPHPTRVAQPAPPVRSGNALFRHTREDRSDGKAATHGRVTSGDLGQDAESRVIRLIESQPHLNDFDVAKAVGWRVDPFRVGSLRERLGANLPSASEPNGHEAGLARSKHS